MTQASSPQLQYERAPCPKCGAATEIEAEEQCCQAKDFADEWSCPGEHQDADGFLVRATAASLEEFDLWCAKELRKEEISDLPAESYPGGKQTPPMSIDLDEGALEVAARACWEDHPLPMAGWDEIPEVCRAEFRRGARVAIRSYLASVRIARKP
jgi:hypothetical protein